MMLKSVKNGGFQVLSFHRASVVARTFVARRGATDPFGVYIYNSAATFAALDEAREQIAGTATVPISRSFVADLAGLLVTLASLHLVL